MPASLLEQIGSRIRTVRKAKRMTQVQAAALTGIRQSHWSRIEAGRLNFQIDTLEVVTQGLRVSLSELVDGIVLRDLPE